MNKLLPFIVAATIAPASMAQTYINIGTGIAHSSGDTVMFTDGTQLSPSGNDSSSQITLGQRFNRFGAELSYRSLKAEDSKEFETYTNIPSLPAGVTGGVCSGSMISDTKIGGNLATQEVSYNAKTTSYLYAGIQVRSRQFGSG